MTSPDPDLPRSPGSPPSPELIHLRGSADLVATLPYHLGYRPTDSLVLIGLHGAGGDRMGFVARVDLPAGPEEVWPTADRVVPPVIAQAPHRVLLVAYEAGSPGSPTSEPLSRAVRDLVRDAGIEVAQRLVVRDGRFWDRDCTQSCCPVEGTPVPDPTQVPAVADYVLLGRSPLQHRDDLATIVAPADEGAEHGGDDGGRLVEVVELGRTFQHGGFGGFGGCGPGLRLVGRSRRRQALQDWGLTAWSQLMTVQAAGIGGGLRGGGGWRGDRGGGWEGESGDAWSPSSPAPRGPRLSGLTAPRDLGVLLAASLRDVALRDLVITWLCPGSLDLSLLDPDLVARARAILPGALPDDATTTHRVAALCRVTPTGTSAAPLTVFANLVWWHGDGALARTALDLALEQEPGYRLALLLERMLDLAIPPRRRTA